MDIVFYIEIGGGGGREGGTAHVGSFGEREHALSFAHQARRAGYRPRFVVGPLIADHIRRAGFEPEVFWTPEEGVQIVENADPGLIVGCELFNLSPESARGLMATGRPMATIDGTSLAVPINTDPFELPQYRRSLVLPEHFAAFRPCPVNDIATDTDRLFHWSLFPDAVRTSKDATRYAALGLDPSRRTVMLPIAPWAIGSAAIFGLEAYYQRLIGRIVDGLEATGEPVDLVVILLYRPASLTLDSRGAVRVHYSGLMDYDSYDHLLRSCDLFVTDNIISTSASKAMVMGTPHLILENMGEATGEAPELAYRWNMFPLKVLFPADREYSCSVDRVEYRDADAIRSALGALLRDGYCDASAREKRRRYLERLRSLPTPGQILDRVVGPPRLAEPSRTRLGTPGR